jgi:hypothetical protein
VRKRLLQGIGLLALALVILLVVFTILHDPVAESQRHYEKTLLGKTVDEVKGIMPPSPYYYRSRDEVTAYFTRTGRGDIPWPEWQAGIGGWCAPTKKGGVVVRFDQAGKARAIEFHRDPEPGFVESIMRVIQSRR